jgi:multicomponent Na+:H+ antiporter subunit A
MYRTDAPRPDAPTTFPLLHWLRNGGSGWVLGLLPLALVIWFASMLPMVLAGETLSVSYPWAPTLGVTLSFAVDGLGLLFALIISGVGTLIVIYAGGYMAGEAQVPRFYLYLFLFMGSMLGVVLVDNVIALFVFWELTSITSYLLIGFKHAYASSRSAALQALLVTGAGGLAMLAGMVLLGIAGGTFEISELVTQGEAIRSSELYIPILVLVLIGAFTKSAQFPFHFWLPSAMAAPTPVSAYLHSATMVKAGVYLLARLSPVLAGTLSWQITVTAVGGITMLLGAYLAVLQVDLKRILAFTTISALGTLVMMLGIGTELAVKGAMVFLIVHSCYKGGLFMVAGAIDHETGTRDISGLGGLRTVMPVTAIAAGIAALSMSGIPPFLGFVGKEVIYDAALELPTEAIFVAIVAVFSNILMIMAAGLVAIKPFFGPQVSTPKKAHEAPVSMWLGPSLLGIIGLLLGLLPGILAAPIVGQAAGVVLNEPEFYAKLYLIPDHFSSVIVLSIITVAGGVVAYIYGVTLTRQVSRPLRPWVEMGPDRVYTWLLEGMQTVARWQTRNLQSGFLRYYLLTIISTTVLFVGLMFLTQFDILSISLMPALQAEFHEWILALVILIAAWFMVHARTRLSAVVSLGVVGFGVALIFTLNSAPDLAMTQFAIETLSVILFVLVLYRLPFFTSVSSRATRVRDGVVALLAGGLMTGLILAVNSTDLERRVTPYFADNSYVLAQGRNVVNVILVDFRSLDTMGEIAVIGIAAIGIYTLLKLRPNNQQNQDEENEGDTPQ